MAVWETRTSLLILTLVRLASAFTSQNGFRSIMMGPDLRTDSSTFRGGIFHSIPSFGLKLVTVNSASSMIKKRFSPNFCFFAFLLGSLFGKPAFSQLPTGWKAHDVDRARPEVVTPGVSNLPLAAPSDAIVLFDGSNLDQWRSNDNTAAKWIIQDGVMESVPGSGYIFSAQSFGDIQLHVEWAAPAKVEGNGQGRGNSGVFLQGLFEVQVLDSFENITYADGQAGAIYGQFPPLVNASRKPGEWQSYDIVYRKPIFESDGKLQSPARLTVLHNGVLIQDHVRPLGPTSWLQHHPYVPGAERRPLSFQDHGNPVRYRNIWLRELPTETIQQPEKPYDPLVVELTPEQQTKIVGKFVRDSGGIWEIMSKEGKLYLSVSGIPLQMVPHSPEEFGLKYTAGKLTLNYDPAGNASTIQFNMGGETMQASRAP